MFNNILIVYKENPTKKHLETVEKVKAILNAKNPELIKTNEIKEENFKGKDLIITIGGDGTFIKAASFIKEQLILGINSEPEFSEGALTSIMESEIDFIKEILKGNFKIKKLSRIKITKDKKELKEVALNEVYIGTQNQFDTSRYEIKFKNCKEEQRSSGILIATPSGSTAWYKSAGGKPFKNETNILRFIVREPFIGRLFQPEILSGEIKNNEKLIIESKRINGGILAIDSNTVYPFNLGEKIEIEISDKQLNIIAR